MQLLVKMFIKENISVFFKIIFGVFFVYLILLVQTVNVNVLQD